MTKPLLLSSITIPPELLLETKLLPPALKDNVIPRPRILQLLEQHRDRKLIVIVTDAGYGKTTLLTQYIRENSLPAVYISLDNKDSALLVFFSYLIRGLEKIDPGLVTQTKTLLQGGSQIIRHYQLLMNSVINELMEKTQRTTYIILDDYHNLTEDSVVHKALDYFIENMPDKVRVIIASRMIPPFSHLAKWRAKQALFEIYRDGLRFTEAEIKTLFDSFYNKNLSTEALKLVSDKTDGWITGIQLILYSASKERMFIERSLNEYDKTRQPLFDYFTREILDGETPAIQTFLKRSSILDVMSAADCNYILGIHNAQDILRKIESRNLFLSAIGDGQYKYHPLFREFLNRQLKEEEGTRSLHERAARYYARRGRWEPVVDHCLAAGDYAQAAAIIAEKSGHMLAQARYDLLNEWLNRIPDEILVRHPRLIILRGRVHYEKGLPTAANEFFNQAETILLRDGVRKRRNQTAWIEVLFERGNLFISEGHYWEALPYLTKALRACPVCPSEIRGDILNQIGLAWDGLGDLKKARHYLLRAKKQYEQIKLYCALLFVECHLTLLLEKQGEVRVLHDMFKSLIERLRATYCWRAGYIFSNAGKNAMEMGNDEWAEYCLNEGLVLCQEFNDRKSLAGIYAGLAALYIEKENWERAQNYLDIAAEEYQKLGWPNLKSLQLCSSRLYRYQQDNDNLRRHLKPIQDNIGREKIPLDAALLVEYGLSELMQGNITRAREAVKRVIHLAQRAGWKKEEFLGLLAEAELNAWEHRDTEARRKVDAALDLARVKGYDGILKCELRHRPKLWNVVQRSIRHKPYIASLRLAPRPVLIRVGLLGGLAIKDEQHRPITVRWPSEKTRSLFTFMTVNRDVPVHREMILEQIWPGLDPDRANVNFRNTATRLRQALVSALNGQLSKDCIFVFKYKKYHLLAGARIQLDTEDFEALLKEANHIESSDAKAQLIFRALNLYRGDFLPEIYDPWTDPLRRRLRENLLNHLHWLAGHTARVGDYQSCVTVCEKYLALEPFSEEITCLCMRVLARLGQISGVKARYERLKRTLRQELRANPSAQTQELYRSLVGAEPPK